MSTHLISQLVDLTLSSSLQLVTLKDRSFSLSYVTSLQKKKGRGYRNSVVCIELMVDVHYIQATHTLE